MWQVYCLVATRSWQMTWPSWELKSGTLIPGYTLTPVYSTRANNIMAPWSLRSAQVPDLALKKVQCIWRQDWHKCRTRKGCVTLGTGNVCYLAFKIHVMHRSVFFERGSKEFWLASSFEGHGSSLRSLPHPSNYPRTPFIWFKQQVLLFNLRLAMICHVYFALLKFYASLVR